jgi:serine/threonine-protein kinase
MHLSAGTRFGAYEILGLLGSGGMGEVYRARDAKLQREIAIKVLPQALRDDPERLARFEREAKSLAALSHPNIAHIHGYEDSTGVPAIVMELVEGPTLADQIARGPIPLDEALPIAKQIADALEAAHEQGIVHRDLKPANIKVRADGTVKVLDFGLAKAMAPAAASSPGISLSPTLSIHATQAGIILGTAAYMSPEQARGRTVDKRADVWAFGCVLFEMLTGARAFDGEDVAETIGAVIHKEPAWTKLPAATPSSVRPVLQRCLEKDPRNRMRDIADVRLALDGAFDAAAPAPVVAAPVSRAGNLRWLILGAIAGAAITTGWFILSTAPEHSRQPARFTLVAPADYRLSTAGTFRDVALSPTGRHIVYTTGVTGSRHLVVRAIDQVAPQLIRGTTDTVDPFFSPDGKWIGFFERGGELKKVAVTGGPSITVCKIAGAPRGATWGDDDTIVFASADLATGLMSVPASGGQPRILTKPDANQGEVDHVFPSMLPGARAVLFTIAPSGPIENAQIAVLDLKTGIRKTLIRGGSRAEYAAAPTRGTRDGSLVYAAAGSLRAVRFDPIGLGVLTDPVPVVDQVLTKINGTAEFSVASSGDALYVVGEANIGIRSLVWVDRLGHEQPIPTPPRAYTGLRISPDGTRVALDIRDQQAGIWILDIAHGSMTPLTFNGGAGANPVWTPDSRRIIFNTFGANFVQELYSQAADNTGGAEPLARNPLSQVPTSVSPDGQLVFHQLGQSSDVMLMPLNRDASGPSMTRPLIQTAANELNGEVSPDGRWIAYESAQSGPMQIFVRPFPNVNAGLWQLSIDGGIRPAWSRDGRELFFLDNTNMLNVVEINGSAAGFTFGNARRLLNTSYLSVSPGRMYDVSPDGKRFLMIKDPTPAQGDAATNMIVVLNFAEELMARVPTK